MVDSDTVLAFDLHVCHFQEKHSNFCPCKIKYLDIVSELSRMTYFDVPVRHIVFENIFLIIFSLKFFS